MTLALALEGKEHLILAADRQQINTYDVGNYASDVTKLKKVSDSCAFACAGKAHAEVMFSVIAKSLSPNNITGMLLYNLGDTLKGEFEKLYRAELDKERNSAHFLVVGLDDEEEFCITTFQSPLFLTNSEKKFRAIGSGQQSTYFLNLMYRQSLPTLEEATLLACFCINETAKQDLLVGREMDIWILRKGQPIEELTQTRIGGIRKEAEEISGAIAEQFLRK